MLRSRRSPTLIIIIIFLFTTGVSNALVPPMTFSSNAEDAKIFATISSALMSISILALLAFVVIFPYNFAMLASPNRKRIYLLSFIVVGILLTIFTNMIAGVKEIGNPPNTDFWFDTGAGLITISLISILLPMQTVFLIFFARMASEAVRKTVFTMTLAINSFIFFVIMYILSGNGPEDWVWIDIGVIALISIIAYRYMTHKTELITPIPEISTTSTKSSYKLLQGRIYIVEEERPRFAFELFSEILRRRCYDCENDESFICESLDCSTCGLPCPCRECSQYPSRTQGLVIIRRHPDEIRERYFIQTTPIVWLTSIPGKDNMDPAKLSLLTDMIVNFIEKSANGAVIVEGIEYLVTANDFLRTLRAIDRWSEAIMSNSSRLIISLNPKAFNRRELALIERNREFVKPGDYATMEKILATSS